MGNIGKRSPMQLWLPKCRANVTPAQSGRSGDDSPSKRLKTNQSLTKSDVIKLVKN